MGSLGPQRIDILHYPVKFSHKRFTTSSYDCISCGWRALSLTTKTGILEFASTILLVDTLLFHFTPIPPCLSVVCIPERRCFLAHKLVFLLFDLNTNHCFIAKPMLWGLQYDEWQEALSTGRKEGGMVGSDGLDAVLCLELFADISLGSLTYSSFGISLRLHSYIDGLPRLLMILRNLKISSPFPFYANLVNSPTQPRPNFIFIS